jgi:hypothetical protein
MQRALRPTVLVRRGFDLNSAVCDGAMTLIAARAINQRRRALNPDSIDG